MFTRVVSSGPLYSACTVLWNVRGPSGGIISLALPPTPTQSALALTLSETTGPLHTVFLSSETLNVLECRREGKMTVQSNRSSVIPLLLLSCLRKRTPCRFSVRVRVRSLTLNGLVLMTIIGQLMFRKVLSRTRKFPQQCTILMNRKNPLLSPRC